MADKEFESFSNESKFLIAISCGRIALVKQFIQENSSILFSKRSESLALWLSIKNGHDEISKLLIDSNANCKVILHHKHTDSMEIIPENELMNDEGKSLLHVAVAMGNYEIVQYLLDKYPELVHFQNALGKTVMQCIQDGEFESFPPLNAIIEQHSTEYQIMEQTNGNHHFFTGTTKFNPSTQSRNVTEDAIRIAHRIVHLLHEKMNSSMNHSMAEEPQQPIRNEHIFSSSSKDTLQEMCFLNGCPRSEKNPNTLATFEDYLQIHEEWKKYISYIPKAMFLSGVIFAKLEYVGALITILEARNPTHVGTNGIIVDEYMHKFKILTRNNKKFKIDKKSLKFELEGVQDIFQAKVQIKGERLIQRPIERTTKKFKM